MTKFGEGFNNADSNSMSSPSTLAGVAGLQVDKTSALLRATGASSNVLRGLKSFGNLIGGLGVGLTVMEGFLDGHFSIGDFTKVGISASVYGLSRTQYAPIAIGYTVLDFGYAISTGSSVTDRVGIGVDNVFK